jgi:DNA-binding transcriptional ArsR family regulator
MQGRRTTSLWLTKRSAVVQLKSPQPSIVTMKLEQYFRGLADVTRLRMLNLLLHGELCGCDIQYVLEMSQPNVSRHLTYLKNCGLVLDRRDGPCIFYRLAENRTGGTKTPVRVSSPGL